MALATCVSVQETPVQALLAQAVQGQRRPLIHMLAAQGLQLRFGLGTALVLLQFPLCCCCCWLS